ncbi:MAG: DUF1800 family protein [Planctomycetota bacterium]
MRRVRPEEALLPYEPTAEDPFDRRKAAHLARRAGFGATRAELDRAEKNGLEATLDTFLHGKGDGESFAGLLEQVEAQLIDLSRADGLRTWWLYRMLHTKDPLRERMTLFWHDHFATSIRKVYRGPLMLQQNELFRQRGLGEFGELLLAVSRDPAMLIWLDNRLNVKSRPNENYARELMELFSLGRDRYTEKDIKEVARAFTGWHLRGNRFFFNQAQHDGGEKTLFGVKGKFDGKDVIDLILARPECARFVTGKLWAHFVGPWAPSRAIGELAEAFHADSCHVGRLVARILRSRAFFSEQAWRARIAGPTDQFLRYSRLLGIKVNLAQAGRAIAGMGQALFEPPTVEGWKEEDAWLSARWSLSRMNGGALLSALRGTRGEPRFDAQGYARKHGLDTAKKCVDHFLELLVDGELPDGVRRRLLYYMDHYDKGRTRRPAKPNAQGDVKNAYKLDWTHVDLKVRGLVHLILALPEAQVC